MDFNQDTTQHITELIDALPDQRVAEPFRLLLARIVQLEESVAHPLMSVTHDGIAKEAITPGISGDTYTASTPYPVGGGA